MGTKYSTVSISSYNASPPSDDGTEDASNQINWVKHKDKLGDPLKTAIESINTNLVTALNQSIVAKADNYTITAAEHNKTVDVTTVSAGVSIYLPDAVSAAAGFITTVSNNPDSSDNFSLALTTDTNTINGNTDGTVDLPIGASRTFIVNADINGFNAKASSGLAEGSVPFGETLVFENSGGAADPPTMSNESGQILCTKEIRLRGTNEGDALFGVNQDATFRAFATDVPGDTSNRFRFNVNGAMGWGPGNTAADFDFARVGVGKGQFTGVGVDILKIVDDANADGYAGIDYKVTGTQHYAVGVGGPSETTLTVADKFFVYDALAGKMRLTIDTNGATKVCGGVAAPAAGSSAALLNLGSAGTFGIYYGSGAPTVSAAKGSLYLRTDGSGTGDRAYINTNGGTTWTALTTAA